MGADGGDVSEGIRVLVVDEGPGLTQDLVLALHRRSDVRVIGPVATARDANRVIEDGLADVIVVDLDRHDGHGESTVTEIRDAHDRVRVLASTARLGPEVVASALAAGACGILPPVDEPSQVIGALRRALAGELVLPANQLPRVVDSIRDARRADVHAGGIASLTGRERQILTALSEGATTAELSRSLGISPQTVQSHVKNILSKLGAHSKVEAVRIAWRSGFAGAGSRSA
jgi:DNA-binding NarL/FixJ family response regulator